jgi:hypothetical protein
MRVMQTLSEMKLKSHTHLSLCIWLLIGMSLLLSACSQDRAKPWLLNGKKRYKDQNSHGEYYVLESNGNLGLYGRNGKFDEAIKIN